MKKLTLLALALSLALPAAAQAQDISYTYLEGGYTRIESAFEADGWAVNGSAAISDDFHVFAGYSQSDLNGFNADLDIFNVGIGYNHAFSKNLHGLARFGYENFDANLGGSIDAWFTEVGVRAALGSHVEGWALAGYEDPEDFSGDFYAKIGTLINITPRVGLSAEVKLIDGDQQYFVGPRISF